MILAQLSPPVQRLVAIGLAILTVLLALEWLIIPLFNGIESQRDDLAALREHRAFLVNAQRWPDETTGPVIDRHLLVRGTGPTASRALHDTLVGMATPLGVGTSGVQIVEEASGNAHRFTIALRTDGPHDAVLSFLAAVERGHPLLRVQQLTLEPAPGRDGALTAQITLRGYGATPS